MHDQTSSGLTGILHSGDRQLQVPSTQWASAIVDRAYEAIIFDCDGTLVDSSAAHFKSFELAFENQNTVLEYAWYASRTGLDRIGFLTEFANTVDATLDIERAAADSISTFYRCVHLVQPIQETRQLVSTLAGSLPFAVGTNAEYEIARASLTAVGLIDVMSTIVSITDGIASKPSPDIFCEAARRLATPNNSTLVIEDSPQGVEAARRAGMDVLFLQHFDFDRDSSFEQTRNLVEGSL